MHWTSYISWRDHVVMTDRRQETHTVQLLVLARPDAACDATRFYVLPIEQSLFCNTPVAPEWAREGHHGGGMIELHSNEHRGAMSLEAWLSRKRRRRYRHTP